MTLKGLEISHEPCQIIIKINRGPLKWQSKPYQVLPEDTQICFEEELRKISGFYFTKDGAEVKKAELILAKYSEEDGETLLTQVDLNISNLISYEFKEDRIDIFQAGFHVLAFSAKVVPAKEADAEFINEYLSKNESTPPALVTPQGQARKLGRVGELFSTGFGLGGHSGISEAIQLKTAMEIKELEQREHYQDEEIRELEKKLLLL